MKDGELRKFYGMYPDSRKVMRARIRTFCRSHPDLLQYEGGYGESPGIIVSVLSAASRAGARAQAGGQLLAATAASVEEQRAAELMCRFIVSRGGRLPLCNLHHFSAEHPEAASTIGSGIQSLCTRHPWLLRFEPTCAGGDVISVPMPPSASSSAPAGFSEASRAESALSVQIAPADTEEVGAESDSVAAPVDTEEVARDLARFVASSSDRISTSVIMKEFKSAHPEWKAVFKDGLRDFCAQHPGLLCLDDERLVSVQGLNKSQQTQAEIERAALLWKAHLDEGREHLIGAAKESLQAEFTGFCESQSIRGVHFGGVMRRLQQLGFKKHGTWAGATASSSSSAASTPRSTPQLTPTDAGGAVRKTPQLKSLGDAGDALQVAFDPWAKQASGLREHLQTPGVRDGTPSTGVTSFLDTQRPASKLHLGEEAPRTSMEAAAQSEDASTAPSQVGVHVDHTIESASRAGSLASQLHLCFTPLEATSSELFSDLLRRERRESTEPFGIAREPATASIELDAGFNSFDRLFAGAKASLQHALHLHEAAESVGSAMQVELEAREARIKARGAHVVAKEKELLAREAEIAAREAHARARERAFVERLEAAKLAAEASLSDAKVELSRRLAEVAAREAQVHARERALTSS